MASNPPFQVEDTDEDFFDKLVNDVDDDYKVTPSSSKGSYLADGNDSHDAKAFANLGINDVGTGIQDSRKVGKGGGEEEDIKTSPLINGDVKYDSTDTCIDPAHRLVFSNSFAFDSVSEEPKTEATGLEEPLDSAAIWNHGPSVTEVQWTAFITEPAQAQPGANCMLEDWEENLASINSNRTKGDELVLVHLGDCLWKERSNVSSAHNMICQSDSDSCVQIFDSLKKGSRSSRHTFAT